MAWTAFPTLTDGQILTGAHMQIVQANFAETAPGKASGSGNYFSTSGANSIAERTIGHGQDTSVDTTTSTSYGDLTGGPGPACTITTGSKAIVFLSCSQQSSTVGALTAMSCDISGATTTASTDNAAVRHTSATASANMTGSVVAFYTVTPGSNTFTAKYKTSAGTGTFGSRRILVLPF